MATLKQRLHRKNASGTYDTIYFETSADLITGTLSIAHGGTGQTTIYPGVNVYGIRGIMASTSDLTASSSSLTTGAIYLVYE